MHGLRKFLPLQSFPLVLEPDKTCRVSNLLTSRSICMISYLLKAWATTMMSSGISPARYFIVLAVGRFYQSDGLLRYLLPDEHGSQHLHSGFEKFLKHIFLGIDVDHFNESTAFTISLTHFAEHKSQRKAFMYIFTILQEKKTAMGFYSLVV